MATSTASRKKDASTAQEVEVGAVKGKKGAPAAEVAPPRFSLMRIMHNVLNEVEKKAGLLTVGFGRHAKRLSTGLISLDMYLDGGLIPGGWYTIAGPEQSAKSTLTMTLVAATIKQKFNGVGAVFDYEGSSDEEYITNMLLNFGLEIDREKIFGVQDPETGEYLIEGFFRYYAPERGEEFFAYMSMMRRRLPDKIINENGEAYYVFENTKANQSMLKGQYDTSYFKRTNKFRVKAEDTSMQLCVVVDSYPAMMPEQLDDDDPSAAMALQARMFSDGIKRFRGGMRRKMMTIFGVNQLRERPAVQHGDPVYEPCFIGSTPVHLADGTVDTIRNIVLKKRDVEVLSFNKETGEVSAKRIIDWKDNGNKLTSDLVVVRYNAFDHNGCPKVAEFTCTKDHKIWSPSGWEPACTLSAGDDIYINVRNGSHNYSLLNTKVVSVTGFEGHSEYENVYDLTVEDNHTYFVGSGDCGVAVSNCGNALKFYCVDPMTSVEVKKSDGIVKMTALEYLNTHDSEAPWPIRCPAYAGFIEPKAAFKSDGGKYAARGSWAMETTSGHVLSGSAGHSVLIASPVKTEYAHTESLHDTDIPSYEDPDTHDYANATIPNVCWTRMHRVAEGSYAFVDANDVSVRQSNEQWALFLQETAPELAAMFGHLCPDYEVPFEQRITAFEELMYSVYARTNMSELYDMVMMQFAYIEELATVYLQLSAANNVMPSKVILCEAEDTAPEFYIDFCTEGSWISNGIVSHNSDVRIRVMPRAIPAGFAGERGVVEEPSAEFVGEGRVDRYKFISGRTIKNKLGGIPNQEYWMRLWESDGTGRARGFDPMYDVWWSLKQMGMITGQRNKMKFVAPCPLCKATRALSWQDLKTLVVGSKKQITELCADIGIKPLSIRSWCFAFIRSDEGKQRVRDSIIRKSSASEDSDE